MALTDNLLSYYRFNDNAANTTVTDETGNQNGTASTNTSNLFTASDHLNGAFDLNGSSEYVDANRNINANTTAHTFTAWINADTLTGTSTLFSNDEDNTVNRGFQCLILNTGSIGMFTGVTQETSATTPISTGTWFHVGFVLDGASTVIYVNGSSVHNFTEASFHNVTKALVIGQRSATTAANYFDGRMEAVGEWDRALTGTDMLALYNSGSGFDYPFSVGTNLQLNIGDSWKSVNALQLNIGDSWKSVILAKLNIGDVWKDVF